MGGGRRNEAVSHSVTLRVLLQDASDVLQLITTILRS
jgi:hypothetical protein